MNTQQKLARSYLRRARTVALPAIESYALTWVRNDGVITQSSGFKSWDAVRRHMADELRWAGGSVRGASVVWTRRWAGGQIEHGISQYLGSEIQEIAAEAGR